MHSDKKNKLRPPHTIFNEDLLGELAKAVDSTPAASSRELAQIIAEKFSVEVNATTISRNLNRLGYVSVRIGTSCRWEKQKGAPATLSADGSLKLHADGLEVTVVAATEINPLAMISVVRPGWRTQPQVMAIDADVLRMLAANATAITSLLDQA